MANKITRDDIIFINTVYKELGTYAATARKTGFSAGTVKKYIIEDFNPEPENIEYSFQLPPCGETIKTHPLTEEELSDLNTLRKDILV